MSLPLDRHITRYQLLSQDVKKEITDHHMEKSYSKKLIQKAHVETKDQCWARLYACLF